ncbi:DoxX family protein [Sphingobacterium corticibacterium]|uniref:DoxX family protein n=1 Tax=Sphingobacterium corticibacterium TaxID=2484746 RepID=A0A4Q6XPD1_9SPHI|nr:DoxX family protein [Sphingobacterium corticibacterium]RZF57976.1 DoxX family protein [Sphingobacterium corticibacterium]
MKQTNLGLLIVRLSIAGLMLLHGVSKLISGLDILPEMLKDVGLPSFLAYGVYVGEVIAPLLMIIGFRTRLASMIFVINCLFAIFLVHSSEIFSLDGNGGWAIELLGLYLFGALALVFTGAGNYAVSTNNRWD